MSGVCVCGTYRQLVDASMIPDARSAFKASLVVIGYGSFHRMSTHNKTRRYTFFHRFLRPFRDVLCLIIIHGTIVVIFDLYCQCQSGGQVIPDIPKKMSCDY